MLDMHTDMTGSAVALAVLQALTRLHSPLSVDCWLAISENRTGPAAYKQRDVVTASNGVTIEIVHTDAEGRLVLADTLALACREKPTLVMDYATLAGSCVEALSERYSGVFTNREALHQLLVQAGRECGERVWPFPNDPDFDEDLMSRVADVAQCAPSGAADHILAARFCSVLCPLNPLDTSGPGGRPAQGWPGACAGGHRLRGALLPGAPAGTRPRTEGARRMRVMPPRPTPGRGRYPAPFPGLFAHRDGP